MMKEYKKGQDASQPIDGDKFVFWYIYLYKTQEQIDLACNEAK